ncbi:MAG TPA: CHRD domain-containing protein [Acidimicrobiales bacterium]|nr:CHRD domain-containing protein [Acidimicrobiales bacterium]
MAGTASAQTAQTYTANLQPVPLNGQTNATGTLTLSLNGNLATIHEQVSGLAATFMGQPFPHVQHIHGGAMGQCPTASDDPDHDGVIDTTDAQPEYGPIQTTLSEPPGGTTAADGTNIKIAPSGSSFTYDRTITLDQATMNSINSNVAVIVVHGLDPATAPKAATTQQSEIPGTSSLPMAATAPALCGVLEAMPGGAAQTGAGGTSGTQDAALFGIGGALLLGAGGAAVALRRRPARVSS